MKKNKKTKNKMAKKKNSYQMKAQKKQLLEGVAQQNVKGDASKSAIKTGQDILAGIAGAFAGASMGRTSLLVGMAVTGAGHFLGSGAAASFGVGMMASGGYQAVAGAMSGTEKEGFEGVKERMAAFKEEFKRKLFLDKIIRSKKKEEKSEVQGTNGIGEVQYFTYPNGKELEGPADHLNTLDRIEKQVAESAIAFEARQPVSGEMNGEEEMGMLEVTEQNF